MFIKTFDQLSKNDANIAGGKGASLGEMTKAKIPVPPGFVVLAQAFERFLDETNLNIEIESQLSNINYDDIASVEEASGVIRGLIIKADFPQDLQKEIDIAFDGLGTELVAVRSSATAEDSSAASWAGELESYLNTTKDNLFINIKKCWASLFTPRAIFYRQEKGMVDSHVAVAVVVQKMVQSEVAGIAFTVHPVTKDANQIIIEACWGLGEYIVGGIITPDSYIIDKIDSSIIDIDVSSQKVMLVGDQHGNKEVSVSSDKLDEQKLDGRQIIELVKICVNIEKHYGFPCDIEWARENGKFYIVQSRPITTL